MADYNTHKDFGSGDRICYHGVTDMFHVPKLGAAIYRSQKESEPFLEVASAMDIGEIRIFSRNEKLESCENENITDEHAL